MSLDLKGESWLEEREKMVVEGNLCLVGKGKGEGKVVMGMKVRFDKESREGMSGVVEGWGIEGVMVGGDCGLK